MFSELPNKNRDKKVYIVYGTFMENVKMSPRLKVSSYVFERLCRVPEKENKACLYGIMYDGTLLVVGFSLERDDEEDKAHNEIQLNFPTEVELCGVAKFNDANLSETSLKNILQDVDITDNPLLLSINSQSEVKAHFLIHDRFEETEYEILSKENLWKQFVHIRLRTVLPLFCEATIDGVKDALQSKRKKIASGQVSFHLVGTSVYLFGIDADTGLTGISGDPTIGELIESTSPEQPGKKKKQNSTELDVLSVNVFMKTTRNSLSENLVKTAVKLVTTQGKTAYCISMPLVVDALAMAHRNTHSLQLYPALVEAACRALRLLENNLLQQLGQEGIGDGAGLRWPETFHFMPEDCGHFITRIIPKGISEDATTSERTLLHSRLCLPLSRPMFRRGCARALLPPKPALLVTPHAGVMSATRASTLVGTVRGRYTYHHYMQDRFNDDGWGCAYRSLQTLCSWFLLQGYTDVPVPTHKEIQQCLVDIGDKQASFVGSRQWIGSTEVSFCLESMLGVSSRIIFANCGSDVVNYAPELLHHFNTHGTPIMIGGGVLAHTILGIEYNPETREVRYLILDPHYTGADDLSTVLTKGWCAWKNNDFWKKGAHYNLCLPQTIPAV